MPTRLDENLSAIAFCSIVILGIINLGAAVACLLVLALILVTAALF